MGIGKLLGIQKSVGFVLNPAPRVNKYFMPTA